MNVTLTCNTSLSTVADQVHHSMAMVFPDSSGLFQKDTVRALLESMHHVSELFWWRPKSIVVHFMCVTTAICIGLWLLPTCGWPILNNAPECIQCTHRQIHCYCSADMTLMLHLLSRQGIMETVWAIYQTSVKQAEHWCCVHLNAHDKTFLEYRHILCKHC